MSAVRPAALSSAKVASMRFTSKPYRRDAKHAENIKTFVAFSASLRLALFIATERAAASKLEAGAFGDGAHVLVAAPGKVDEEHLVARQRRRELGGVRKRVRGFERGNDALDPAAISERRQRLQVGDRNVRCTAVILEPCVLGADAWIIEPGRDRVRLDDLPVRVLQQV